MKVHIALPPVESHSFRRIDTALKRYAPMGVTFVEDEARADLVVFLVIGYPETVAGIERVQSRGQKYAMLQACMRSTQRPSTKDWEPLWQGAACVWSYYDLRRLAAEDARLASCDGPEDVRALIESTFLRGVNFYYAPLGCDAAVFRNTGEHQRFTMFTSGYIPESEGVLEAVEAARRVDATVIHLGPPDDRYGPHVTTALGISDQKLAQRYSESAFVAGLRRCEGFEFPAVEGLLCGARPIMFDAPHYRQWFDGFAEFIPERDFETVVNALERLFRAGARPVTTEEREAAVERFNWRTIVGGFWDRLVPASARVRGPRPRLLWVGDAVVSSGFARCTHKTLDAFRDTWEVAVLGLNYNGDPHPYPYQIFPCWPGGDAAGLNRLPTFIESMKPDVVVVQNDPWNIGGYRKAIPLNVPMVGAIAVDGKNCRGNELNGLDLAIFWTRFALDEARAGGFTGAGAVVPLGVDLDVYKPMDRDAARASLFKPGLLPPNAFLVGNVNRNQPRKRLDLTIAYFAEWVKTCKVDDAYLFLHVAPTMDVGFDIKQLVEYYLPSEKHGKRVIHHVPEMYHGVTEQVMALIYNAIDVGATTTQGEGWWLPGMELLACAKAVIAPRWSALAEWPEDAMYLVPCTTTIATADNINSIGGVPDREATIEALDRFYRDPELRAEYGRRGRALVERPCYRWSAVGAAFKSAVEQRLAELRAAPQKDLITA